MRAMADGGLAVCARLLSHTKGQRGTAAKGEAAAARAAKLRLRAEGQVRRLSYEVAEADGDDNGDGGW